MSMIENTFKLKHKAVEKIVKYSNQMSLRTKIRQGYIVMIILFFFIFVLVVGLEIRNYSGKIMILSILVDTFISKISFPMQPGPEIGSISDA